MTTRKAPDGAKKVKDRTCFEIPDTEIAYGIKLTQQGKNKFTVRYGAQTEQHLTYEEAGKSLGEAILHALCCDGKIETTEKQVTR